MVDVLSMIYTIEKINNSTLLEGIKLGYEIYDSCSDPLKAVQLTLKLLPEIFSINNSTQCNGTEIIPAIKAVVGEVFSETSVAIGRILSSYFIPQVIVYFCLSQKAIRAWMVMMILKAMVIIMMKIMTKYTVSMMNIVKIMTPKGFRLVKKGIYIRFFVFIPVISQRVVAVLFAWSQALKHMESTHILGIPLLQSTHHFARSADKIILSPFHTMLLHCSALH